MFGYKNVHAYWCANVLGVIPSVCEMYVQSDTCDGKTCEL